ncbi:unnamed protein product [Paramecium sonneborni]|uniref:Uncharacterized protein n=1 Tax=Paramecium sonneborni TaxID=65129 RepID=A0A8S1PHJ9_9CILI|nr:unnamed protein product [Paramecium sonneborni]
MIQEITNFQIQESPSCMDISKEFMAIGTLDENIYLYSQPFQLKSNETILQNHLLGVIDLSINADETQIVVSSLDNYLRIWDIDDKKLISEIQCDAFANWKVRFVDSSTVVTSGEMGIINFYHIDTKEKIQKIETDPIYYSCSLQINDQLLAVGNEGGALYLIDQSSQKKVIKPHSKAIKTLLFMDNNKILTGSDDGLIKLIDLEKSEIIQQFRGHKYGVMDLSKINEKSFVSCSTDRTIRVWDMNQIYSQKHIQTMNDKPGGISGIRYKNDQIIAAHDCGIICFYAI